MNDYLKTLNPPQLQAVKQIQGPVLIMAGAGSGKTKALTSRIAYMLEQGISPEQILAITFTNKAAKEMKERVHKLVGPGAERIWMNTFHSFGARFLRMEIANFPPYTNKFTIYDADDSKSLIKKIIKDLNLDDKQYQPSAVQATISNAKNQLIVAGDFEKQSYGNFYRQQVATIYTAYEKQLKINNALDFDDLLLITTKLLSKKEIREKWQRRFKYILIDEYQDTNHAQYLMANYIAGENQNICAVGDADQSIYSWRGADVRNIIDFRKDYPNAKIILLEQNYRSTQTILNAANEVIKNNVDRPPKRLWTQNEKGDAIEHYTGLDEHEEADHLISMMKKEHDENHRSYGDMAILYRMNAQSRVIEEKLVKRGIGYVMVGGTKFYDRQEIKDMLAYMKVIANFRDNVSFARIINVPKRGIGASTLKKLEDFAAGMGVSLFEGIMAADESGISQAGLTKLRNFNAMIYDFLNASTEMNIFELLQKILTDTRYVQSLYEGNDPQAETREENIGELLSVAKEFTEESPEGTLTDFLERVALVNDVDQYESEDAKVTLMTIHSAKGLEFPIVFLPGMDEGIFPSARSMADDNQLEEERRLCYVAITRAMEKLYISNVKMRTMYGQIKPYIPSRFIDEIPSDLVKVEEKDEYESQVRSADRRFTAAKTMVDVSSKKVMNKPMKQSVKARFDWKVGDIAVHNLWGKGKVVQVNGQDRHMMIKVEFAGNNMRQLMVAFAPITKEE